jgi:hypothetical protein
LPGTHFFLSFEGSELIFNADIVIASFHYFLGENSVKIGEISNHTHLLLAAAIV